MKKLLSGLLIMIMLLGAVSFSSAETVGDTSATSGIDVVVVLDMSGSMGDNTSSQKKSDKYGYRFDATAMMIGMMDMDGSRIAIVPFAGKPGEPVNIIGLTDISTTASRTSLISELYSNDFMDNTRPDTNIGAALMKANQILLTREDTSNRPMIVLLTDGKNEIITENNGQKRIRLKESLRWQNGQIVEQTDEWYNVSLADAVTREAVTCAKENHIPIYTVALGVEDTNLRNIAVSTGAEFVSVRTDDVWDLPEWFARVLARQIGSSIQFSSTPTPVGENNYEVKIPILNHSVLETNIILPVKGGKGAFSSIDSNSIQVLDNAGTMQSESSGVTLLKDLQLTRGHFVMVKIREPRAVGMWTLRFSSEQPPEDINFNILYNYNIKFGANVTTPAGSQEEFYKTDTLRIQAYFVDENENKVEDPALYKDHRGEEGYEEWMTIQSRWELYNADDAGEAYGEVRASGELLSNTVQNQFDADVNLADYHVSSGNYALVIYASGAGLERRIEIPIELKNHPPVAHEYEEELKVNIPEDGQERTWTVEGTSGYLKPLSEIVTDADNDERSYELRPEDGAQEIVVLSIEDGRIYCKTVQDGQRIKDGEAKYKLHYNDNDGGTGSVDITIKVISGDIEIKDKYDFEVTPEDGQIYKKNEPIRITARLKAKTGFSYADGSVIEPLTRSIKITNEDGVDMTDGAEMTLDGDALVFDLPTTGNKKTDLEIEVSVSPFDPVIRTVHVPNNNHPVASTDETLVLYCDGEKVPAFLGMIIGEDTPEEDPSRRVDAKALFSDDDGDEMDYSEPYFTLPGSDEKPEGTVIRTENVPDKENLYDIQVSGESTGLFHFNAEYDMHITATDGDGETGEYTRRIVIVDLYNKMLTYLVILLILIVALVILILIIHQIRKPRFPKLNVVIREEPSLYESGSEELSPVKTATNINALGVDSDMAEKHGISMELLQNIIVKPVRSRIAVGVTCRKAASNHEVMLEDVRMKTKKMKEWKVGQELTIRSGNGEGLIAIKLEERPADESDIEMAEFGGDSWEEVNQNVGVQGGKKHTRKAERKAPSAEETSTESGSVDDFDF